MNSLLFVLIDATCTAIIVVHFMSILRRTRFISNSMSNLKLNSTCFLTMMSTIYLGNNRLYFAQKAVLALLILMFMILISQGRLTGFVGGLLVVPFLLLRLRHA